MVEYHDTEWGVPLHDDQKHFEFLVLDAFQAGLSWSTILNKRENFRAALDGFDPSIVAKYGEGEIARLLADAGIVRNRAKVRATVTNAQAFLQVQAEFGSFDTFIWQFVDGVPQQNQRLENGAWRTRCAESDAMSAALLAKGFKFVGTTICYAYMQAAGMINDHEPRCYRSAQIAALA